MNKYIAEHSSLTNIAAIIFFGCLFVSLISLFITNDMNITSCIFVVGVIGGILMMFGLVNEL